jgi:iron complex outermembrane receptor protein
MTAGRRVMIYVQTASLAAGLTLRAATGAAAEDEVVIEPIEVEAAPIRAAEEAAPTAFVSTIDLAERQEELETPADVLGESVGVRVRRFGGLGAFSTVSIRGADANQVQFYLDGIPLSQAQNEVVNLANLPLYSLERIDVYRGTVPIGFGGLGGGGVVNLVTKPAPSEPESEVSVNYGSYDTRRVTASHGRRSGEWELLAHATYLGSEGDFSFHNSKGTEHNPNDDFDATRRNNAFDSVAGLAKAVRPIGADLRLEAAQEVFYKDQEVPGGELQTTDATLEELRSLTYLRVTRPPAGDRAWEAAASVFGVYQQQNFRATQGADFPRQDTHNQTGLVGASTTGSHYGLPLQVVSWFHELTHEIFSPFNETSDPERSPDQTRLRLTLALQDEIALLGERVLLVPTIKVHHVRDTFSAEDVTGQPAGEPGTVDRGLYSPAIGVEVRPLPWLSLRGNAGRFERPPSFSELFGNSGVTKPNPELKPETSFNRDVGFVVSAGRLGRVDGLRLEYAYFDNEVEDLIGFRQVRPNQFEAQNFDEVRLSGHEIAFEGSAFQRVRLAANYTRLDSDNRSEEPSQRGNDLPLSPRDEAYLRCELLARWVSPYYEYNYTSRSFLDPANLRQVGSRTVHNLGVTFTPIDALQLNFEAVNLTDNDVRDLTDFPLPGRSFFGGARYRF